MRSRNIRSARSTFQIIPGGLARDPSPYEEKIEARVQCLLHAVEQFVASLPAALLAEQSPTRGLLEELVVKQSALQWIVRVAKHSQGPVRRRLWWDIEDSLAGLEKTLELLPRLQAVELHSCVTHEKGCSAASSHLS